MDNIRIIASKINRPKKKDKYNILTFPTHEGYQTLLDKTGHNFYMLNLAGGKRWETAYRDVPPNHEIIDSIYDELSDIDFILSHERFSQLQTAREISQKCRLPILHMEHVEPQDDRWDAATAQNLRSIMGDVNVFITEHNKKSWNIDCDGIVIPHGIDTETFKGPWTGHENNKKYVLYTVNLLKERDYFCGHKVWERVKNLVQSAMPEVEFKLIGNNPGVSSPVSDPESLSEFYRRCACYINTSQLSPVPMTVMEAMSCGCPVVSTAKQEIPKIIDNGKNGFCSNSEEEMASEIIKIITDKEYAIALGNQARQTIIDRFSCDSFIENWNKVFDLAYEKCFGRTTVL